MQRHTGFFLALTLAGLTISAPPGLAQAVAAGDLATATRLLRQGDYRGAEQILKGLVGHEESGEAEYLLGFARIQLFRFEEAEESLRRSVAAQPGNVDRLHALAKSLLEQGKNLAATEVLDSALVVAERADLHFARAMCALNTGKPLPARKDLEAAIRLQPGNAEAVYQLGRLDLDRGDYESGKGRFEAALGVNPNHLESRFLLGLSRLRTGDPRGAITALEAVVARVPGHVGALYGLGRAYSQVERQADSDATLERFRAMSTVQDEVDFTTRAVQRNPENVDGRLVLGQKLLTIGKAEDALRHLLAARQLAPRRAAVYELMAVAFSRLGRENDARRASDFARRLQADQ